MNIKTLAKVLIIITIALHNDSAANALILTAEPMCKAPIDSTVDSWAHPPYVKADLANDSPTEEKLSIWTCGYDQNFTIDVETVRIPGWTCKGNFLEAIRLRPGEHWQKYIPVELKSGDTIEHSFRLGFASTLYTHLPKSQRKDWIWSNLINMNCTKNIRQEG